MPAERIAWADWDKFRKANFHGKRTYRFISGNYSNLDDVLWCMTSPNASGYFCATVLNPKWEFQTKLKYFYFTDRNTAFLFRLSQQRPPQV
jgi:hypothetical protein